MEQIQLNLGDTTTDNLYPALFQCFTIIICGYVAGRLNIVSSAESKGIGTFVGTFALPSLIFLSLARVDFSTVNWTFLLAILVAKGIVFFAVIFITLLVSKPTHLGRAGIFAIFCTQSNDFALGYPIISALYAQTHPEYALYLYLMAPISLAILNPIAFILMEIDKQKGQNQQADSQAKGLQSLKLLKQILKGIVFNPVLLMTILGMIGNVAFKHKISIYIEGLLEVFGQSFSATALFLLGLRMVGQIHKLKGPALVLPCVLIMVKLIILPVVMRECVSSLNAGTNESETISLSTYAFLYGTIPTAPAVFVFSSLYQLEIDLMASSMVICTFLSGPMMFLSAELISINKDYAAQMKKFGFDLSIVALLCCLWVLIVFVITKKHRRMPHRLTISLLLSQILLAVSVIWGGPHNTSAPSLNATIQQAFLSFSMYSCLLWTSMLSVGILMLQSRGPCFVVTLWPVLGFVAWGAPAVMVTVLLATKSSTENINSQATDAIRLCLLVFCLTVTTGCLIVYIRLRRRSALFASLSAEATTNFSPPEETSSLVENMEPTSQAQSVSGDTNAALGCYGTITASPSPSRQPNGCCSNDPDCENDLTDSNDIEDLGSNIRECACPSWRRAPDGACPHSRDVQRAAAALGLLPHELARARTAQLLKHTVLIIIYSLSMFIGITYTTWRMMLKDESGVFVEIEFLDVAANYGQGLVLFILFGVDPEEILVPTLRYLKTKWYGADTVILPPIEDLSFETKHVCDQFISHHLDRCRDAIAKDTRWRMRTYRGVFRGSCLVKWLIDCGLAKDEYEAVTYGRHLVDGRLIAHVSDAHHFTNSPMLYAFK
ncbi:integral membrane protein GPR155 isoform X1 [Bombyx mandarina]|uniref:Integral membrane protein GPR155 isoform X1 n=1 Tax=Bombyx mandarina TaxID=7092 RepID=A0A6J2K9L5_BOMMA|nr:integral membrane protein GPR155 isoform X1 [Bombyx mandarina]XP_028038981.1 integral membrane protein GPR155 isoform X2 [Bombyx mandarina]XP_028038982.1 integral membrane protein GPR155 isoform X1 [Bombyx mandarina]